METAFDNELFTFWWTLSIMGLAYGGFLYTTLADTVSQWWRGEQPPEPEPTIIALPVADDKRKAA